MSPCLEEVEQSPAFPGGGTHPFRTEDAGISHDLPIDKRGQGRKVEDLEQVIDGQVQRWSHNQASDYRGGSGGLCAKKVSRHGGRGHPPMRPKGRCGHQSERQPPPARPFEPDGGLANLARQNSICPTDRFAENTDQPCHAAFPRGCGVPVPEPGDRPRLKMPGRYAFC